MVCRWHHIEGVRVAWLLHMWLLCHERMLLVHVSHTLTHLSKWISLSHLLLLHHHVRLVLLLLLLGHHRLHHLLLLLLMLVLVLMLLLLLHHIRVWHEATWLLLSSSWLLWQGEVQAT